MALINCRECGKEISDKSQQCVHCGCPTAPSDNIDKRCIRCGAWLNSYYCPKCGFSAVKSKQIRRRLACILLPISAVFLVISIVLVCVMPREPAEVVYRQDKITLAQFDAIEMGMTYREVCDILGSGGELLSRADLGMGFTYVTELYMWEGNSLGGNAIVTFQGGRAVAKAQFGLR